MEQMMEIVDKTMSSSHLIKIDNECKQEMEVLGFDNYIRKMHDYIQERKKVIE